MKKFKEFLLEYYKEDERFQQSVMDLGMPTKADRDRMKQETGVSLKYSKDGSPVVYSPYNDISDPTSIPDFYTDFKNRMDMETLAMDPDSQKISLGELETLITTKGPQRYNRRLAQHDRQEQNIASQIERERDARFPELAKEKREIEDKKIKQQKINDFLYYNFSSPIWKLAFKSPSFDSLSYRLFSTLGRLVDKNLKDTVSPEDKEKLQTNPTVRSMHFSMDDEEKEKMRQRQIKNPELFRSPPPKQQEPKQEQKFRHWSQSYHP